MGKLLQKIIDTDYSKLKLNIISAYSLLQFTKELKKILNIIFSL
jgi:enoyl-[acyl-carrier-protein] reductase (NADH)